MEKGYPEKMEHPIFVPAISQGSLGKIFFPSSKSIYGNLMASLASSCREQPMKEPWRDAPTSALGLDQPLRADHPCWNALSSPRESSGPKMHLSQCLWHWLSSGFAPVPFTTHPRLCPTTLCSPPGSCLDPPGPAQLILLHCTAPSSSPKPGTSLSDQALPMQAHGHPGH